MNYVNLFLSFLKIGAFTFGGGYAMLPLISQEVAHYGWLTPEELINFIAVSESTPGPLAVNMSTYVGMKAGKVVGAFCATLGVVLPSFVIILIVAHCYESFKKNKYVKGCMYGLKPAVVGLIACAVLSIFNTVFGQVFAASFEAVNITNSFLADIRFWISALIFAIALYLTFKKKLHPILIICICAVAGIVSGYATGL